ncbi:MAG: hypothetical protein M3279_10285 [Actinomycetota bacterium]|nr:hypothetical protein [Actinomycetota bacterium]
MRTAEARRRSLEERLAHIDSAAGLIARYPESLTDGAKKLLETVGALTVIVRESLSRRWSRWDDAKDSNVRESALRRLCDDYHDVVQDLGHLLIPVLEGASPQYIPVEIEPIVQFVVERAAPTAALTSVLHSTHRYNYSIARVEQLAHDWFQELNPDLPVEEPMASSEARPLADDFVFVSAPRLERDSAPLHAVILGHELGHLRDWHHGVTDATDIQIPNVFLKGGQPTLDVVAKVDLFLDVSEAWLSEFVADIFAAFLIGPAAVWALSEITSILSPIDVDWDTHPGTDRRVSVMLDVLRSQEFDDRAAGLATFFSEFGGEVDGAMDRPVDIANLVDNEPAQEAWSWIQSVLPGVIDRCRATLAPDEAFEASRWSEVVPAADKLTGGFPCGEFADVGPVYTAASERVIINAAWLVKVARLKELAEELGREGESFDDLVASTLVLNDLVLKSFEIARYRRSIHGEPPE